jgi:HK97 family phage prohead protease
MSNNNKTLILQQRIKELKAKVGTYSETNVFIEQRGRASDGKMEDYLDKRIIRGYLFVWNVKDLHGTKFIKGCCSRSIRERGPKSNAKYKITFLWQHRTDDPLSLFSVLEEDDYGLYFETKPLDDVPNATRTITQIRSGTLNQFSGGFNYMWDMMEYDESDDSIVCKEIEFLEGSIVTMASQMETHVVRGGADVLEEETDNFVKSLPRKFHLQARQLFSKHKSLINQDALILEKKDGKNKRSMAKSEDKGYNLDYLIKKLETK